MTTKKVQIEPNLNTFPDFSMDWSILFLSLHSVSYYYAVLPSGIPEFRSFGQKGKFSTFGFRFRPPKVKAEYGRNSRKALDFFFPSVFQDGLVFLIHFWQLIFASTLTFEIVHY